MTDYAAAAAAQLSKIAATIDRDSANRFYPTHTEREERHKVAQGYSILAAIEKGLLPADWAEKLLAGAVPASQ